MAQQLYYRWYDYHKSLGIWKHDHSNNIYIHKQDRHLWIVFHFRSSMVWPVTNKHSGKHRIYRFLRRNLQCNLLNSVFLTYVLTSISSHLQPSRYLGGSITGITLLGPKIRRSLLSRRLVSILQARRMAIHSQSYNHGSCLILHFLCQNSGRNFRCAFIILTK